jgi:hypothetical protein
VFDSDILVLDYILLSPRWRGLKLGLMVVRKIIDLLGGGCGLAVSFTGKAEAMEARRKLRRHGFRRVGRTRFDAMSLTQVTPTLEEIIQPWR